MSNTEWVTLMEVNDRLEAEIITSALTAQGIPAAFFQEGVAHYSYPLTVGPMSTIEICVPQEKLQEAQDWVTAYRNGNLEDEEPEHNDPDHE